jgi:hypothetical protein
MLTRVVFQLGVPTVFAAVLLWFVIFKVEDHLRLMVENDMRRTALIAEQGGKLAALVGLGQTRLEEDKLWREAQISELKTQTRLLTELLPMRRREQLGDTPRPEPGQ